MSEEIKKILDMFTKYKDDWYSCEYKLKPKQCVAVLNYITNLQQKVEQLEKENKELNRFCELYGQSLYNADLTKAEKRVEQLENIRKEAKDFIKNKIEYYNGKRLADTKYEYIHIDIIDDLLNILNKGSEE